VKAINKLAQIVQDQRYKLCRHGLSDFCDLLGTLPVEDPEKGSLRFIIYRCRAHKHYGLLVVEDGKPQDKTPG
jgi:hypothetical protein